MQQRNPTFFRATPPSDEAVFFTRMLMRWHVDDNRRTMPWKGELDPYRIWLSEIILQQTRVEQGWAYYERFIRVFPDVSSLAAARDTDVFKLWEGLGYYARCRNLLKAARTIVLNYGGVFPSDYAAIRSLSGVGPYTAAAVGSFAFGLPYAVVDGNVLRVLARYFGVDQPVDTTPIRRMLDHWAQLLLHVPAPGAYNQAIMDFGATVCKPAAPLCHGCPLQAHCRASIGGLQDQLPVKSPKSGRRLRWFDYVILKAGDAIGLRERTGKDVWQHLHEPILIEWEEMPASDSLRFHPTVLALTGGMVPEPPSVSEPYVQLLSHQEISGRFLLLRLSVRPDLPEGYRWVPVVDLPSIPFPRHIRRHIDAVWETL